MDERRLSRPLLWINPIDRLGQPIDPALIAAAHRIFSRVVYLTSQFLHDETRAPQVLEEVVYSASEAMHKKSTEEEILNPEAYLFRAVVRSLGQARAREAKIEYGYPMERLGNLQAEQERDWVASLQRELEIEELLSHADSRTRELYAHWAAGDSWNETARIMGISSGDNARALFRYGIRRALDRLLNPRGSEPRPPED